MSCIQIYSFHSYYTHIYNHWCGSSMVRLQCKKESLFVHQLKVLEQKEPQFRAFTRSSTKHAVQCVFIVSFINKNMWIMWDHLFFTDMGTLFVTRPQNKPPINIPRIEPKVTARK